MDFATAASFAFCSASSLGAAFGLIFEATTSAAALTSAARASIFA
jgi:hypothetical protein